MSSLRKLRQVGRPAAHDSLEKHVTGKAKYVDDLTEQVGMLHAYIGKSECAHGRILKLNLEKVAASCGVVAVLTASDIVGENDVSPHSQDQPLLASDVVNFVGQPLFIVVAETREQAMLASELADVEYDPLPAIITLDEAILKKSFIGETQIMQSGDASSAIKDAPNSLSGTLIIGGQEHFYLEGQIATASPLEDKSVRICSSTQNPSEVQRVVGRTLGLPLNAVIVANRRMGGGFGGKETDGNFVASVAALACHVLDRPVKFRLDRNDDIAITGKRHDFQISYLVGFSDSGRIKGLELTLRSRCGYSQDLSLAVNDRAMFHATNAYAINDVTILSERYRTNTVSNTAFRGFGGPQGMMGIETVMEAIAAQLDVDPLDVRRANFYGSQNGYITPYGQRVEDFIADKVTEKLVHTSDYSERRRKIDAFNASNHHLKRGIAISPVQFGISFTLKHLNQAGALIHIYLDGSIHLSHGGTEMGQGLYTKVAQIVAHEFQVDMKTIHLAETITDKVPNTSATAASASSDLNGMAARDAATTLKDRLITVACDTFDVGKTDVEFYENMVRVGSHVLPFSELVVLAYQARVSLSATGFYKTPDIDYDYGTHKGSPFYYYAYGACCSEVVIDTLTGESRVLRVDILHDVGSSLNSVIDKGQIEGGYIQGLGWLTTEQLHFTDTGRLATLCPSNYKIPTCSDRPEVFNIDLWDGENPKPTIHRSKAVGEPPFMLAISAFAAISQAISSCDEKKTFSSLEAPATPENILNSIADIISSNHPAD